MLATHSGSFVFRVQRHLASVEDIQLNLLKRYRFVFEGRTIDVITASDPQSAKSQFYKDNPKYRRVKGEIYWEVICSTSYVWTGVYYE